LQGTDFGSQNKQFGTCFFGFFLKNSWESMHLHLLGLVYLGNGFHYQALVPPQLETVSCFQKNHFISKKMTDVESPFQPSPMPQQAIGTILLTPGPLFTIELSPLVRPSSQRFQFQKQI
jgi:hypothetical protein